MQKYALVITLAFALSVTLFSVSVIFLEFYKINKYQYINNIFSKYSVITQIFTQHNKLHSSELMLDANLAIYDLRVIKDNYYHTEIIEFSKLLKRKSFNTQNLLSTLDISMLSYQKVIYFHIVTVMGSILIEDNGVKIYSPWNILYTYISIVAIIIIAHMLILQKLRPLIRLRKKIAKFGNGDLDISFAVQGSDEIALVANELESAKDKISTILDSRTLFLRNLMHELKTPITKGIIATQMLDSKKQKDRFSSIFKRLETLVLEFALIEEVTSINTQDNFKIYRLIDVIDGAIDLAMVDRNNITVNVNADFKIRVDYNLYKTAIKNMIDNGLKYSDDSHIAIRIVNKEVCFESRGKCLSRPLSYYIEPFTKNNPSKNSFGLGLYLVDSILKAHKQVLAHEYQNGTNCFIFAEAKISKMQV